MQTTENPSWSSTFPHQLLKHQPGISRVLDAQKKQAPREGPGKNFTSALRPFSHFIVLHPEVFPGRLRTPLQHLTSNPTQEPPPTLLLRSPNHPRSFSSRPQKQAPQENPLGVNSRSQNTFCSPAMSQLSNPSLPQLLQPSTVLSSRSTELKGLLAALFLSSDRPLKHQ